MPLESIRVSSPLPASAARVYAAWLDSREHSLMTGGAATVEPRVGGRHSAWDGYIEGEILELEPAARILQTWRSSEFPAGHPHSRLEIRLRDAEGGCEISLAHSEIPEGQAEQYEAGWQEHYFIPMTKYFREVPAPSGEPEKAATGAKKIAETRKAARPKKVAKPKRAARPKKAVKAKKGARKTTTAKPPRSKAKRAKAAKAAKAAKKTIAKKTKKPKTRAGTRQGRLV